MSRSLHENWSLQTENKVGVKCQTERNFHLCVCVCGVNHTCQAERPWVVDGLLSQLPHVHADGRDDVRPHIIRDAHLELVGGRWSVLLDDEETSSLVQDKITAAENTRAQLVFEMDIEITAF